MTWIVCGAMQDLFYASKARFKTKALWGNDFRLSYEQFVFHVYCMKQSAVIFIASELGDDFFY